MNIFDNLFPVLFAVAGIMFVVWGISEGEEVSEIAPSKNASDAAMPKMKFNFRQVKLES